jgi:hypothetical protein
MLTFACSLAFAVLLAPPASRPSQAAGGATKDIAIDAGPERLFELAPDANPLGLAIETTDRRHAYLEGERFSIGVTAKDECHIVVVSRGPDGVVTLLAPGAATAERNGLQMQLAEGATFRLPSGTATFRAASPHGTTEIRVFATREPLPEAEQTPSGEAAKLARLLELLVADAGWSMASLTITTGKDRDDLDERMRAAPSGDRTRRRLLDDLLIPPDAVVREDGVARPEDPSDEPPIPRRNPSPPLKPGSTDEGNEIYRKRWEALLAEQGGAKAIGTRFVPARPPHRAPTAGQPIRDLLVVRAAPDGAKALGGWSTSRVPFAADGSKAIAPTDEELRARIRELKAADPTIVTVVPNREVRAFMDDEPALFRPLQWQLRNEGCPGVDTKWLLESVRMIEVEPVKIGLVDQGLHVGEPRIAQQLWTNPGETAGNGVDDDGNGLIDDVHGWNFASHSPVLAQKDDAYNHGTYCASIMMGTSARGPDRFWGIAPNSVVVPAACLAWDDEKGTAIGSIETTFEGIRYVVERGAKVVNLSLGGPATRMDLLLQELHPIWEFVREKDVLLVVAAGNEDQNIDETPVTPACLDLPNMIVVMAVDPSGGPARAYEGPERGWRPFSNYGRNAVDIAAPGAMIIGIPAIGQTSYSDGTSFAAPMVTAVAAALWAEHPDWDAATVRRAILETAQPVEGLEDKCRTGGMLDIHAAFRFGR